jgi:glycine oxidase
MLRVRQPIGTNLHVVLRSADIYIVPRKNGSLILGATVEDAGFDRTIRREATGWLLERGARLWEPLERIDVDSIEEVWTGIRPGTPDDLPIFGPADDSALWYATGHYRNGILLAPATAQVMADLVCGDEVAIDLQCFAPGRFTHRMEHRNEAGTETYETVCANGNHS